MKLGLFPVTAVLALGVVGCRGGKLTEPPITYVEAGAPVVKNLCTLLEGWTENQTVISICATVEEVLLIASTLVPLLGDDADAGACTLLPGTTACATKKQIGRGIQIVLMKRRARLLLDAGAEAGR